MSPMERSAPEDFLLLLISWRVDGKSGGRFFFNVRPCPSTHEITEMPPKLWRNRIAGSSTIADANLFAAFDHDGRDLLDNVEGSKVEK